MLHGDAVIFKRRWITRLQLTDDLKVMGVDPTRFVNGHVHSLMAVDPPAPRTAPVKAVAGNPRMIMFT